MDIVFSVLMAIFVALLIGATLTFGFTLLVIILLTAAIMAGFIVLQSAWRRWRFLHSANPPPAAKVPPVIEGDYKDISRQD